MSNDMNKQNLIEAFDMAKSIELSAAELYEQIAAAPDIQEPPAAAEVDVRESPYRHWIVPEVHAPQH